MLCMNKFYIELIKLPPLATRGGSKIELLVGLIFFFEGSKTTFFGEININR
jgi:hypothetical protein